MSDKSWKFVDDKFNSSNCSILFKELKSDKRVPKRISFFRFFNWTRGDISMSTLLVKSSSSSCCKCFNGERSVISKLVRFNDFRFDKWAINDKSLSWV